MHEHRGCGTRNPFGGRWVWAVWAVTTVVTWCLVIPFGLAAEWAWFLLPIGNIPAAWWEWRHRPSRMYVTWWP